MKAQILLSIVFGLASSSALSEEVKIKPSESKLVWHGSKVVGGSHHGTLAIKNGTIVFKDKNPQSANVTVDMTTIANSDLKDAKWNKKLVNHLRSDDFFAVKKFGEARLEIKKFEAAKGGKYTLKGNLTIKKITKPVTLTAEAVKKSGKLKSVKGLLVFDRTEFNVRYGSGKFFDNLGDKMISDEVKVEVTLAL